MHILLHVLNIYLIIYFEKLNSDTKNQSFCVCQNVTHFAWYDSLNTISHINNGKNGIICTHSGGNMIYLEWKKSYFIYLFIYPSIYFYVYGCFACASVPAPSAGSAHGDQERESDHLDLGFQMVVSYRLNAENRTQVLCYSSQCPQWLSSLSSSILKLVKAGVKVQLSS